MIDHCLKCKFNLNADAKGSLYLHAVIRIWFLKMVNLTHFNTLLGYTVQNYLLMFDK